MTQLTQLGFQILELIERRQKDDQLSLTRESLNNSIRIPDRDFNMSISFYEQQGWLQYIQDCYFLTPVGKSVLDEYRKNNPTVLPAISLK
jgi:hypothetical protein